MSCSFLGKTSCGDTHRLIPQQRPLGHSLLKTPLQWFLGSLFPFSFFFHHSWRKSYSINKLLLIAGGMKGVRNIISQPWFWTYSRKSLLWELRAWARAFPCVHLIGRSGNFFLVGYWVVSYGKLCPPFPEMCPCLHGTGENSCWSLRRNKAFTKKCSGTSEPCCSLECNGQGRSWHPQHININ